MRELFFWATGLTTAIHSNWETTQPKNVTSPFRVKKKRHIWLRFRKLFDCCVKLQPTQHLEKHNSLIHGPIDKILILESISMIPYDGIIGSSIKITWIIHWQDVWTLTYCFINYEKIWVNMEQLVKLFQNGRSRSHHNRWVLTCMKQETLKEYYKRLHFYVIQHDTLCKQHWIPSILSFYHTWWIYHLKS